MGRTEADRQITSKPKSSRATRKPTQELEEKTLLSEWRSLHKKVFDTADIVRDVRLSGWSQWVDATLKSNPTCVGNKAEIAR
jgi:hypothetical protein